MDGLGLWCWMDGHGNLLGRRAEAGRMGLVVQSISLSNSIGGKVGRGKEGKRQPESYA